VGNAKVKRFTQQSTLQIPRLPMTKAVPQTEGKCGQLQATFTAVSILHLFVAIRIGETGHDVSFLIWLLYENRNSVFILRPFSVYQKGVSCNKKSIPQNR
jgi:hypothetical protein